MLYGNTHVLFMFSSFHYPADNIKKDGDLEPWVHLFS